MLKKKHVLLKTPQDKYCKNLLNKAKEADNLLISRNWMIENDEYRKRVKSHLMDARTKINQCFSIYRKMVMEGYNSSMESDDEKLDKIRKGFTAVKRNLKEAELGKSGGPSNGILNKKTYPMVVKRYRNILKTLLEDMIVGTVGDVGGKTDTKDDFYRSLFIKTYQWTGSLIFKIWGKQEGGEEGEFVEGGTESEEERMKVDNKFIEQVGEIT